MGPENELTTQDRSSPIRSFIPMIKLNGYPQGSRAVCRHLVVDIPMINVHMLSDCTHMLHGTGIFSYIQWHKT